MNKRNNRVEDYKYEENSKLLEKVKNGNQQALDELIKKNLPLVSSISKKFIIRGYDYEDIFQIGCIGLVKAVNNFNSSFNVKFSTYAVPMILGEIRRYIRDDGMMKVSRTVKSQAIKIHYAREELSKKLNRAPTIDELSSYTGIEKEELVFAMESNSNLQYLYDTIHQEDGIPVLLIDKLSEEGEEDGNITEKIALKEALSSLDERGKKIIILRYFKDKTQIEVAKMLGISQVQVSRIEKKVLNLMREKLQE